MTEILSQKRFKPQLPTSLFAFFYVVAIMLFAGNAAYAEDVSALRSYFKVEGQDAFANASEGVLSFSATRSQYNSGHGHGWRNEAKVREDLRLPVGQTHEHFSATVTPHLPAWAKTIVAQYHFEGLSTAMKVYLQDSTGGGMVDDGVPGNGVFDILARITGPDGKEGAYPLGTVRSGESFDLDISFNAGTVRVGVTTAKWGHKQTPDITLPDTDSVVYFKFGDYLQAMNAAGKHTTDENEWKAYYAAHHIDDTEIDFSHVRFTRQ